MRFLIWLLFVGTLVMAVPRRPGWRPKFEECYATWECTGGYKCCTPCPRGAECGPGTKYAPTCDFQCGTGDREFVGGEKSYIKNPGDYCRNTYECPYDHTCCTMCMADAPCGPGTQFSPRCQKGPCGQGPDDPNYREFNLDVVAVMQN